MSRSIPRLGRDSIPCKLVTSFSMSFVIMIPFYGKPFSGPLMPF
jgi:hypothetical protein